MTAVDDQEHVLLLDWAHLEPQLIVDRIKWMRESLASPEDWGYCEKIKTCVLKNQSAIVLYKLRWFYINGNPPRMEIARPTLLDLKYQNHPKQGA